MKNPGRPEDQLPYLDTVKRLIILDLSTQIAAFRTGKLDVIGTVSHASFRWEEAKDLRRTNPEAGQVSYSPPYFTGIAWRVDKPDLPWYDKRVRHALSMAVDNRAMMDFWGGYCLLHNEPSSVLKDIHTPFEQLPKVVQELYGYYPDKAKQLLAEAGYPKGFKCEIICQSPDVDMLSIIKKYWAAVGVELTIDVKEYGVYTSMTLGKGFKHMATHSLEASSPEKMNRYTTMQAYNPACISDPKIDKTWEQVNATLMTNPAEASRLLKELFVYILEQAYYFYPPAPLYWVMWQPWVKDYHGEQFIGKWSGYMAYPRYVWVDEALKKKLTR